jgi:hypothetical protein
MNLCSALSVSIGKVNVGCFELIEAQLQGRLFLCCPLLLLYLCLQLLGGFRGLPQNPVSWDVSATAVIRGICVLH